MKKFLRTTCMQEGLKASSLVILLTAFVSLSALAQTTINSGVTTNASSITAGNSITIKAGGTLNMNVARSFASITTSNSGTSTISGSGLLTVTGTVTLAAGNTLALTPACEADALATASLSNNSAGISGAGTLTVQNDITINKSNGNNTGTLVIGSGTTIICASVAKGSGSSGTWLMTVSGTLKVSGSVDLDGLTCNSGSTMEYNGSFQDVFPINYHNLTLSGYWFKTLSTSTTNINGNFTLSGSAIVLAATGLTIGGNVLLDDGTIFYAADFTHNVAGNWTNNGSYFLPASGTIVMNGVSQTIGGTAMTTFNNLTTTGAGTKTLGENTVVSGTLSLNNTAPISIGDNTLTLSGTLTGAGKLKGSSSSSLVIDGAAGTLSFDQTSASTRSLKDITLNAGSSATLGSALEVYGTVSLTTATLHVAAQSLTLKSNATGTARVANLTGSTLDGVTNVTVERFIKLRAPAATPTGTGNYGRAYRLIAPTVNSTGSIKANWQEGQMNTVIGTNVNTVPGYGTHITGSGGNTNGFDRTITNAASLYSINNGTTPTYTAVTSANGTLNAKTGYFLYLRGDRSTDINLPLAANMPTSSTTLRSTGTLITGTQTSFTNSFISTAGAMNLVTNPYASPIDWSAVVAGNSTGHFSPVYTIWDPNIGTRGGFVTVTAAGVATPASSSANQYIQGGQAFFIQADGTGPVTLSIKEDQKITTDHNNNNVFRGNIETNTTTSVESFAASLYFTEADGYRRLADGVMAVYDNNYSKAVDGADAREVGNWDENIAIAREGSNLAVESRPVIQQKDTLPLFMNNMKQRSYEFEFTPSSFTNTLLKAELVDNFLGTRTLLSVTAPTVVSFTVTADPASAASNRFTVVFGAFAPLAIDKVTIKAYKKAQPNAQAGNGAQVEWVAQTETDMDHYEVERSFNGTQFSKQASITAMGNSSVAANYTWFDATPQFGNNFYRIKAINKGGEIKYTSVVKVTIDKDEPAISVYPNPVTGPQLGLQLLNISKGTYNVDIYNTMGQLVFSTKLQHPGGAITTSIHLGDAVMPGNYRLVMTGQDGLKLVTAIMKNR